MKARIRAMKLILSLSSLMLGIWYSINVLRFIEAPSELYLYYWISMGGAIILSLVSILFDDLET